MDNASIENLGLMFGSDPVAETVTAATAATETLTDVKLGYWYPLGVADETPDGAGAVASFWGTSDSAGTWRGGGRFGLAASGGFSLPSAPNR